MTVHTKAPYRPANVHSHPSVDPSRFRDVFRSHAAGVVVITAEAGFGPVGFTATSLASVSLSPPLVAFALSADASSWPTVRLASTVIVHFLSAAQQDLATRFATSGIDRFAHPVRWTRSATGDPLLLEPPSRLTAVVDHRVAAGDHYLVVARVTEVDHAAAHPPLIYQGGRYRTATDPVPSKPREVNP